VHTSAGGTKVRITISNTFGDHPLLIGGAHIARRTAAAEIDPTSDRTLMFLGRSSTRVPARSMVVSDPVELDVPALSDLAISLFFLKPRRQRPYTFWQCRRATSRRTPGTAQRT
jgi:hypothetical protein